jgi:hypothetical protein
VILPKARVSHQSRRRLRIRIPAERGNQGYFATLRKVLAEHEGVEAVEVNQITGSVLLLGDGLDVEAVRTWGKERGLFKIEAPGNPGEDRSSHLPARAVKPLQGLQNGLDHLTGGNLNLSGLIFFALLGTGIHQILRGNFTAPPWYTSFWYAFGVFTKQLVDKAGQNQSAL